MFEKTGARHSFPVSVMVTLAGEAPFEGAVFVKLGERLSDLLNDQRAFIPLRRADGSTVIAAKAGIVSMAEIAPAEAPPSEETDEPHGGEEPKAETGKKEEPFRPYRPRKPFDAYEVLRVSRLATTEEIRRAYKTRIKSVHPDTIAALDLDADLERAANLTAQKVNHAYQSIMRERKDAAAAREASGV